MAEDGYTNLATIMETTRRLAFNQAEGEALLKHLKANRSKGLETGFHPNVADNHRDILKDGVVMLGLAELGTSVLFVKVDGGRGLLGGQKSAYLSYVGGTDGEEYMPGTTFRSWTVAVTSINNIYRNQGLL